MYIWSHFTHLHISMRISLMVGIILFRIIVSIKPLPFSFDIHCDIICIYLLQFSNSLLVLIKDSIISISSVTLTMSIFNFSIVSVYLSCVPMRKFKSEMLLSKLFLV